MANSGRISAHQLKNGLYVSGRPEAYKDNKTPTMSSTAVPYTGGDIKKSGELGKMFDIPVDNGNSKLKNSGTIKRSTSQNASSGNILTGNASRGNLTRTTTNSGNVTSQGSKSGPLGGNANRQGSMQSRSGDMTVGPNGKPGSKNSGPLPSAPTVVRTNSGNLLPATGLITSGPLSSAKKVSSGPLDRTGAPVKAISFNNNPAVSKLSHADDYSFQKGFPKSIFWTLVPLFIIGFIAGAFILVTVRNPILLVVVAFLCLLVCMLLLWNICWGKRALLDFVNSQKDVDLSEAKEGQYVKVTGVVTCGSVPLETSFQKHNRCVYVSTGLFEYRGWNSKPARTGHRLFAWGLRYSERHVADFYISDFRSGLRALVKAGGGARATPYVEEEPVADCVPGVDSKGVQKDLARWMSERNLSADGRPMRLKEGYIKEGSTVTVMGVVQKQENVLMIGAPGERVSTGCQWKKLLLPGAVEGLLIACTESSKFDGIPL